MDLGIMRLVLILEGEEGYLAGLLKQKLEKVFGFDVVVRVVEQLDVGSSYDPSRGQYNAVHMLTNLEYVGDYTLVITGRDLYVQGLNYVFGYAPGKAAVVSTYRLRLSAKLDEGLYVSRVLKEAVHEVGHVLGLSHCTTPGCVMNFSNNVQQVDMKSESFCGSCLKQISVSRT
ncbi:MAG: archaemetzincin family Zn-dependent metalloprotease [Candidatus Caldarchaeum sp.]